MVLNPAIVLTAVLKGDLFEAMRRADDDSVTQLFELCMFIENEFPSICYGNTERVIKWMLEQQKKLNKQQENTQNANT